jgi:formate dehydrogenase iron-sulfur subunit
MDLVATANLVDALLASQQRLTAVERFSQAHRDTMIPAQSRFYQDLIPLSQPGAEEQYSFEVDLDICSGCKACVIACHSLNGLDEGESWRDVGALITATAATPSHQTVTSSCHHCLDPACANGCPTLAYEKDTETGIVRHLDDQCIGCQYCTLTCPYDAPKFNKRLGIVRKCDMCQSRLKAGEAPACVQACPNEAIRIRVVRYEDIKVRALAPAASLVPGTVSSNLTLPSTNYLNLNCKTTVPVPGDHDLVTTAHSHTPLALMLGLTQAGAGLILADVLTRFVLHEAPIPGNWHAMLGASLAALGLGCATAHLGRPLQAWRSFLGWRRSWLSREILVFGPWVAVAMLYAVSLLLSAASYLPTWFTSLTGWTSAGLGLTGVFCSIMVYAVTRRPLWSLPHSGLRFVVSMLMLGSIFLYPGVALSLLVVKVAYEAWLASSLSPFPTTSRLLSGPLRPIWHLRLSLAAIAAASMAFALNLTVWAIFAFVAALFGEILDRSLYFRSVAVPKMPGGIRAA